jgi:ornithine cyclodeaminase/alanine dehydrogenase-like protein (mu-crystallin family)
MGMVGGATRNKREVGGGGEEKEGEREIVVVRPIGLGIWDVRLGWFLFAAAKQNRISV